MGSVVEKTFNGITSWNDNFVQYRISRGRRIHAQGCDAFDDFAR